MINERLAALALTLFLALVALVPTSRPAHAQQFIASQIDGRVYERLGAKSGGGRHDQ